MNKNCSKCKINKNIEDFYSDKRRKCEKQSQCKNCQLKQRKECYDTTPEAKEKRKEYCRKRRKNPQNRAKDNKSNNRYYHKNKKYFTEYRKKWRKNENNKNNEKKQQHLRYNTIQGKLNGRISAGIYQSLKGNKNRITWKNLVGYDDKQLKQHIEKQFQNNMDWDKFLSGEIELDHILPLELFEFNDNNDPLIKICWGLNNLQPLWETDNNSKSDTLPDGRHARNLSKKEKIEYLIELGIINNI
jgi:hypothetical protein